MLINFLGFLANLTSLLLWVPQARVTWKNRGNIQRLKGISIGTQVIVIINTLTWCLYGIFLDNLWLSLGTIIILPLAVMTIVLKVNLIKKEKTKDIVEINEWFTFSAYRQLNSRQKIRCLELIYNSDFDKQICKELLNWQSYEEMNLLDKMYWDKELWLSSKAKLQSE